RDQDEGKTQVGRSFHLELPPLVTGILPRTGSADKKIGMLFSISADGLLTSQARGERRTCETIRVSDPLARYARVSSVSRGERGSKARRGSIAHSVLLCSDRLKSVFSNRHATVAVFSERRMRPARPYCRSWQPRVSSGYLSPEQPEDHQSPSLLQTHRWLCR